MRKKHSGFDRELADARKALHNAADVIAELAKEEPKIKTENRELETENRKPVTSKPTGPAPAPRPVPVHPTGHHEQDVANLEKAINKAGAGGIVLLKAKDRSGKRRPFNLSAVTDLTLPFEVSLKSEKNSQIKFND